MQQNHKLNGKQRLENQKKVALKLEITLTWLISRKSGTYSLAEFLPGDN